MELSWIEFFTWYNSWILLILKLQEGQIEDDLTLRQAIFFGGVEPQLRANVWPFLLHYYDFRTTFQQRQAIMEEKHQLYQKIKYVTKPPCFAQLNISFQKFLIFVYTTDTMLYRSPLCWIFGTSWLVSRIRKHPLYFQHFKREHGWRGAGMVQEERSVHSREGCRAHGPF